MAIVKPEQMDFSKKNLNIIIAGLPGTGKTTLALSAPDVLLVDFDEGLARIKPEHRKDSIIVKSYEDFLADVESAKGKYKTIVIDTGGAEVEMMKDWAMRTEHSAKKKSGGFSQQGYGIVKSEFLRLSAMLRKNFHVITIFHVAKDKQDDTVFYDLVCEGSAKTLVYQPADLAAYLHIVNGERYLGFTPTMNYNAKSAYGIKGLVKVPELEDGAPNGFMQSLFSKVLENLAAEGKELAPKKEAYKAAMEAGMKIIDELNAPEDVKSILAKIKALSHGLTSEKELNAALKAKMLELKISYDKAAKEYRYAEA